MPISIRELRHKVGIGQVELAHRVGVSQSFISQLEQGTRSGTPNTLEAIAAELKCTVEDITGEPVLFLRFIRNCKRLSNAQLNILNELVIQFVRGVSPAEINESEQTAPNSSSPKCPAPEPCEDIMANGGCGRVPKCFSKWSTSGN